MNKVAVIGIIGNSVFMPVEKFHVGGETIETKAISFEYGGKGFNQAVAAARFNAKVSFLGAIGKNDCAKAIEFLKKENIVSCLKPKETPTAFAAIITDKTGANRVTVYQGAQLEVKDVYDFAKEIKSADVLLINNEVGENVNLTAVKIAKGYGVKVILNPAPQKELPQEIKDNVYLFTPNEFEAKGLENYDNVIQTLGEKGCYIKSLDITVPSTKVKAVDTTGAGDTFSGVLAATIAQGESVIEAVKIAVKASGKSVERKGAVSSIPYKKDIY